MRVYSTGGSPGRFSYVDFVAGRVRRLFPAYLAMVFACMAFAPLILLPGEFERLAQTALASLVFLSNVFFYGNLGYFDAAAEQQLLLHTWSLAVEWQFYLVFPVILWASYKLTGGVKTTLLILGGISLALNIYLTPADAKFTFFMFPARAWELIAGGLLGLAYMRGKLVYGNQAGWSAIGLTMLGVAIFGYDKHTPFPGLAALLPIVATGILVLNVVQGKTNQLTTVLASKPLVLIGQMSYSLYLWHWPILLYARFYFGDHLTILQLFSCWSLTVLLSYFSWRWIESALRQHRTWSTHVRTYFGAAAISLPLAIAAGLVMLSDGFERRLPDDALRFVHVEKWPDFGRCSTDYVKEQYYDCLLGSETEPASTLIWGDSHAQTLIWAFNRIADRQGTSLRHVTKGGCPPLFFGVPSATTIDRDACLNSQRAALQIIDSDPSISTVFLAARWPLYESSTVLATGQDIARFELKMSQTVQQLLDRGIRVIVVDSLPEPGFDVANTFARQAFLGQRPQASFEVKREPLQSLTPISEIDNEHLEILSLTNTLCSKGYCPLMKGQDLLYFDGDHLAKAGATLLIDDIEEILFANHSQAARPVSGFRQD